MPDSGFSPSVHANGPLRAAGRLQAEQERIIFSINNLWEGLPRHARGGRGGVIAALKKMGAWFVTSSTDTQSPPRASEAPGEFVVLSFFGFLFKAHTLKRKRTGTLCRHSTEHLDGAGND